MVGARVWPMTKIASAFSKSSRLTVPLPTPITFSKAQPLDSWHMLEQSGKLFVPNCRGEKLIQEGCLVARLAGCVNAAWFGDRKQFNVFPINSNAAFQVIGR